MFIQKLFEKVSLEMGEQIFWADEAFLRGIAAFRIVKKTKYDQKQMPPISSRGFQTVSQKKTLCSADWRGK